MVKRRRKRRVTFHNPIHKPHGTMSLERRKRLMEKILHNSLYGWPHNNINATYGKMIIGGKVVGFITAMELTHNARSLELRENL